MSSIEIRMAAIALAMRMIGSAMSALEPNKSVNAMDATAEAAMIAA